MSPVDIIYCDNHLLVLDKPGGLLTTFRHLGGQLGEPRQAVVENRK